MERLEVDEWSEAILLARSAGYDGAIRVPKTAEPSLPESPEFHRSNFPWSIHKGAVAVYREATRDEHLQLREYPDYWVVSLDHYNPRYRPIEHAAVDIPMSMLLAMGTLTPLRGYRWVFGDRLPSPTSAVAFSTSALGAFPRFGLGLLP